MAKQVVTRTYTASIRNQQQVSDDLDSLGFSASKLWNVGRWTISRIWDEIGYIPEHDELTAYLKSHERYDDLHSQSSQRVLQELAEAFNGWYGKRRNGDVSANPPGYRKHGDDHPRSTVTFKAAGFKLDTQYERVRLSKGSNLKEYWSDFTLCEYQTCPDVDLSSVESVQQVRAVWTGDEWELHFVCKVEVDVADTPGEKTVGVDLGINNFAALAYEDGHSELYPLNCLKQDDYYFSKRIARCDDSDSEQATRLNQKKSRRRTHYFHTLSKHIVRRCVAEGVGTIVVGDLSGIREDEENGEAKNWGTHGNLDLHSWAFDRFTDLLEYKAEMEGISIEEVSEQDTSKSCSCCGRKRDANRVERGLYVCDQCGMTANADVNGAENIRQKVSPSPATDGGDRSNGWLAQPSTFLFDKETGVFAPQEQVTS
ncbi:IS1341-type transposase ISNma11 (plasmid) [Natrialba magadii ATCC 43099]|uniref:IS1341-type transposase ISNma11 n=1 Tax=Natrialba magadii (strain ATCC 43099 / DSM 3394 / CCM 3739 / CIP 104546 / IAM 13178 / JCM 8861 / NBRC 102185 / NCIMB 2190 / MS3) TaxID=547559 RepID=D3T1Q2_NATMM|nr:RNA-guided endonuclease TnpB family protein [Natrialba magadii]ADD07511.1 IS1341-type transposase ISNma11 [Natrialba magadii ATCC 43099]ELY26543.1 transposase, IS605 OrfB family protein [Natrialba magadii ATCC 43099]